MRWSASLAATASLLLVAAPPALGCPEGNLVERQGVQLVGPAPEAAARVADGTFVAEGSWDRGQAFRLDDPLVIDLGEEWEIRALLLQADHDDAYNVEGSLDGAIWRSLATAAPVGGGGLRSRRAQLDQAPSARYLRVSGRDGDGVFWVSEIAAWCRVPAPPPASRFGRAELRGLQASLAVAGLALFVWGVVLAHAERPSAHRRVRDGALAVLGLAAGLSWWNVGRFHFSGYVHLWEHYHYFLGAKYFNELGYTQLYPCTAVADLEDGLGDRVGRRRIRDTSTNRAISASAIVADPGACKRRFSPERWESFKRDVGWFRGKMPPERWERLFLDHGYNAPPVWTLLGQALTANVRASDPSILVLALIDPVLLVAMWGAVLWAFGWRAACVGLLWWGTNRLSPFGWTGGGFLRQDWLVLSIVGICLVRRQRSAAGGFALGCATLLRVFPGFLVAALVLNAGARSWRARRIGLAAEERRFLWGCGAALAVFVPLSLVLTGGVESWSAFVQETRANLRSTGPNVVGLMAVLSYEHAERRELLVEAALDDPDERWLEAKRDVFERRRVVGWLLTAAFVALLARAVRHQPLWAVLVLGLGLIPIASFLACYYYSILLGFALLWERRGELVGLLLCALSAATHLGESLWPSPGQLDQRFAWDSLATVIVVVLLTGVGGRPSREEPA